MQNCAIKQRQETNLCIKCKRFQYARPRRGHLMQHLASSATEFESTLLESPAYNTCGMDYGPTLKSMVWYRYVTPKTQTDEPSMHPRRDLFPPDKNASMSLLSKRSSIDGKQRSCLCGCCEILYNNMKENLPSLHRHSWNDPFVGLFCLPDRGKNAFEKKYRTHAENAFFLLLFFETSLTKTSRYYNTPTSLHADHPFPANILFVMRPNNPPTSPPSPEAAVLLLLDIS